MGIFSGGSDASRWLLTRSSSTRSHSRHQTAQRSEPSEPSSTPTPLSITPTGAKPGRAHSGPLVAWPEEDAEPPGLLRKVLHLRRNAPHPAESQQSQARDLTTMASRVHSDSRFATSSLSPASLSPTASWRPHSSSAQGPPPGLPITTTTTTTTTAPDTLTERRRRAFSVSARTLGSEWRMANAAATTEPSSGEQGAAGADAATPTGPQQRAVIAGRRSGAVGTGTPWNAATTPTESLAGQLAGTVSSPVAVGGGCGTCVRERSLGSIEHNGNCGGGAGGGGVLRLASTTIPCRTIPAAARPHPGGSEFPTPGASSGLTPHTASRRRSGGYGDGCTPHSREGSGTLSRAPTEEVPGVINPVAAAGGGKLSLQAQHAVPYERTAAPSSPPPPQQQQQTSLATGAGMPAGRSQRRLADGTPFSVNSFRTAQLRSVEGSLGGDPYPPSHSPLAGRRSRHLTADSSSARVLGDGGTDGASGSGGGGATPTTIMGLGAATSTGLTSDLGADSFLISPASLVDGLTGRVSGEVSRPPLLRPYASEKARHPPPIRVSNSLLPPSLSTPGSTFTLAPAGTVAAAAGTAVSGNGSGGPTTAAAQLQAPRYRRAPGLLTADEPEPPPPAATSTPYTYGSQPLASATSSISLLSSTSASPAPLPVSPRPGLPSFLGSPVVLETPPPHITGGGPGVPGPGLGPSLSRTTSGADRSQSASLSQSVLNLAAQPPQPQPPPGGDASGCGMSAGSGTGGSGAPARGRSQLQHGGGGSGATRRSASGRNSFHRSGSYFKVREAVPDAVLDNIPGMQAARGLPPQPQPPGAVPDDPDTAAGGLPGRPLSGSGGGGSGKLRRYGADVTSTLLSSAGVGSISRYGIGSLASVNSSPHSTMSGCLGVNVGGGGGNGGSNCTVGVGGGLYQSGQVVGIGNHYNVSWLRRSEAMPPPELLPIQPSPPPLAMDHLQPPSVLAAGAVPTTRGGSTTRPLPSGGGGDGAVHGSERLYGPYSGRTGKTEVLGSLYEVAAVGDGHDADNINGTRVPVPAAAAMAAAAVAAALGPSPPVCTTVPPPPAALQGLLHSPVRRTSTLGLGEDVGGIGGGGGLLSCPVPAFSSGQLLPPSSQQTTPISLTPAPTPPGSTPPLSPLPPSRQTFRTKSKLRMKHEPSSTGGDECQVGDGAGGEGYDGPLATAVASIVDQDALLTMLGSSRMFSSVLTATYGPCRAASDPAIHGMRDPHYERNSKTCTSSIPEECVSCDAGAAADDAKPFFGNTRMGSTIFSPPAPASAMAKLVMAIRRTHAQNRVGSSSGSNGGSNARSMLRSAECCRLAMPDLQLLTQRVGADALVTPDGRTVRLVSHGSATDPQLELPPPEELVASVNGHQSMDPPPSRECGNGRRGWRRGLTVPAMSSSACRRTDGTLTPVLASSDGSEPQSRLPVTDPLRGKRSTRALPAFDSASPGPLRCTPLSPNTNNIGYGGRVGGSGGSGAGGRFSNNGSVVPALFRHVSAPARRLTLTSHSGMAPPPSSSTSGRSLVRKPSLIATGIRLLKRAFTYSLSPAAATTATEATAADRTWQAPCGAEEGRRSPLGGGGSGAPTPTGRGTAGGGSGSEFYGRSASYYELGGVSAGTLGASTPSHRRLHASQRSFVKHSAVLGWVQQVGQLDVEPASAAGTAAAGVVWPGTESEAEGVGGVSQGERMLQRAVSNDVVKLHTLQTLMVNGGGQLTCDAVVAFGAGEGGAGVGAEGAAAARRRHAARGPYPRRGGSTAAAGGGGGPPWASDTSEDTHGSSSGIGVTGFLFGATPALCQGLGPSPARVLSSGWMVPGSQGDGGGAAGAWEPTAEGRATRSTGERVSSQTKRPSGEPLSLPLSGSGIPFATGSETPGGPQALLVRIGSKITRNMKRGSLVVPVLQLDPDGMTAAGGMTSLDEDQGGSARISVPGAGAEIAMGNVGDGEATPGRAAAA